MWVPLCDRYLCFAWRSFGVWTCISIKDDRSLWYNSCIDLWHLSRNSSRWGLAGILEWHTVVSLRVILCFFSSVLLLEENTRICLSLYVLWFCALNDILFPGILCDYLIIIEVSLWDSVLCESSRIYLQIYVNMILKVTFIDCDLDPEQDSGHL